MEPTEIALLVLRLWLGVVMLAHGINHARNLNGTASWFESKGFRRGRINALASAAGEVAIGLGLVSGLLTSVASAGLVATMTVAFGAIHRFAGFFVFSRPDEGYEYVATLAVAASALAIAGPGSISLDSFIGLADRLDGWVGAVFAAGGLVAGAAQLAIFWRLPSAGETSAAPATESVK